MAEERRKRDDLRELVDSACEGRLKHTQEHIKIVARKAYYLGVGDGIQCQRDKEREK